jgi:hypothetical protein
MSLEDRVFGAKHWSENRRSRAIAADGDIEAAVGLKLIKHHPQALFNQRKVLPSY